jgi:hypothetical protein
MTDDIAYVRRWILTGSVCGISGVLIYTVVVAGVLPVSAKVLYPIFWLFGPLMVVSAMGTRVYFRRFGPSVAVEIATTLWIVAGALVCLMGCLQGSIRHAFGLLSPAAGREGLEETTRLALAGADAVQLGADIAWDIFIFSAVALYGIVMLRRSLKWKIVGVLGLLAGVSGLALNLATWPVPPAEAGLVDVGPLVGLWGLTVSIVLLAELRTIE